MKTRKMKDKTETTLRIAEIGAKGDGVGEHMGKPVYVAKTAPGDQIRVHLDKQREDGYAARLISIETPSPARAAAPCPYFGDCGGCALQHVSDNFYQTWKIEKIKNFLRREGVEVERWETPVFLPAATRRRTTLTALKTSKEIYFGYNEARSNHIVDVKKCLVLEPALDDIIQRLRAYLPRLLPSGKPVDIMLQHVAGLAEQKGVFDMLLSGSFQSERKFSLDQHEAMAELIEELDIARLSFRARDFGPVETLLSRKNVIKCFGDLVVELPPAGFLQPSAGGEEALTKLVLKYSAGGQNVADLFCGAGTFAGNLLKAGAKVFAADGDSGSILSLEAAAKTHPEIQVARRDLFKEPLSGPELANFDVVVFDPPRAGAKEQAAALAGSQVRKIVAVSCNPATFARDARILQDGGYRLAALTPVDQFVYAAHIELVASFTRS